ncbi:hypothetical protein IFM89_035102 [Coptis chinensis]|uniref:RanBD1 domain-containing protein n=1 Tax=Coptis chinensis TaxID=261450 RepID=A0A835IFX8_9MAGN|nr:hypothetical protein IFM89_035102 [Coptis chinensis]
MMKGRKRSCIQSSSDSNLSDPNTDSPGQFGSKRIMRASPFESLDPERAESSRQHVRALNTQFASWVQSQLQNHPDELWEDGLQDYLTHASHIMDTFRDVVDWLKANGAKAESIPAFRPHSSENKSVFGTNNNATKSQNSLSAFGSRSTQDKSVFGTANNTNSQIASSQNNLPAFGLRSTENSLIFGSSNNERKFQNAAKVDSLPAVGTKNNETKFQIPEKSGFAQVGSTSSFANSWSPSIPSTNPASVLFEDDLEQPSSPSVKKSEEKGVVVVHEVKCKLYVKSTDPADNEPWKDRGMGQLSIKCKEGVSKATKESKPTLLIRNDVGKVLLNALIYPGIKINLMKNAIAAIFHTSDDSSGNDGGSNDSVVARTYLIRTRTEEDRNKLASAIREYAPAA